MTEPDEQPDLPLSQRDIAILGMVGTNLSYRDVAKIFDIHPGTAHRWVDAARRRFAEMHGLPLEALHLDERPRPRNPNPDEAERRLLYDFFLKKYGRADCSPLVELARSLSESEALPSDEPDTRRQWTQDIKQARHTPPKRQR